MPIIICRLVQRCVKTHGTNVFITTLVFPHTLVIAVWYFNRSMHASEITVKRGVTEILEDNPVF